jgi:hypothetical protein
VLLGTIRNESLCIFTGCMYKRVWYVGLRYDLVFIIGYGAVARFNVSDEKPHITS